MKKKIMVIVLAMIFFVPLNVSAWNYGSIQEMEERIQDMENQQEQQRLEMYRLRQERLQKERPHHDGGRSLLY
jgi:hypothetical protein